MKDFLLFIIFFFFIFILNKIKSNRLILVESNKNIKFMVINDENKHISTEILTKLVTDMYDIKNHLINNIHKYDDHKEYINLLKENFTETRTSIYENDPKSELTSFSVNKGEELAFCLKSKKTNEYHDHNLLMYVALHEMAHMACPEIGHGELFKKVFRFITLEAINRGLYKKVDYSEKPVEYCGMVLSSTIV
jgi:predicted metal-dependent hydrolase